MATLLHHLVASSDLLGLLVSQVGGWLRKGFDYATTYIVIHKLFRNWKGLWLDEERVNSWWLVEGDQPPAHILILTLWGIAYSTVVVI